ncbi:SAM domain and HD [Apophysomyces sp. BC1015]|nr:SAM domain and HD [Apophysomyces sp. BC1015]
MDEIVSTYPSENSSTSIFPERHKVINDPIHGHIRLDNYTVDFIDTVQFQRLRDLKQLGSAYFVFPGGSHNRFEHSIGVSHLSGCLIERFQKDQPELDITPEEIKCVKLAGLCHDLGHGPFSHVFDSEFMPHARPGFEWSHEQGSEMMLEYLIDDNNIDIDREHINLIKDLIDGTPRSQSQLEERKFLFDIVANKKNSVDVDKFDYIERDAQNLGLRSSYDAKRLLLYSRVVDDEICYHHKEVYNLYEMFHTRYSLFKRIYTHRVGKAVELMITDALLSADPYLGISTSVDKPEEYLHMTDDIIRAIERSKNPELEEARQIMKRLRTRDLYKFVDEFLLPAELESRISTATISAQEIISHQSDNDGLTEHDVIVSWLKINYAMKDRNPVDSIRFFSKFNDKG